MTKKVAIFISGSGSNMVCLVNSMYKQNFAWPSLVLSNKSCAQDLFDKTRLGQAKFCLYILFTKQTMFEPDPDIKIATFFVTKVLQKMILHPCY